MREHPAPTKPESDTTRPQMWPRWVGIVLPALVNCGFLLANDDRPNRLALLASLLLLVGSSA